ncbi:hypothetical protein FHR87_002704 [Azomonas macrocytogenes]|uniref:Uncharacterized protein n=1 Tax=Azomonas macrocytogenes TaxID=69962 RepID=A0A839T5G8_AZOMA|nr:hypothetical protein [Azomonas macrocytogenes]
MCLASVGGAILPLIFAKIEAMTGSKSIAFIAPLICWVYVLWFALAARKTPTHAIKANWPDRLEWQVSHETIYTFPRGELKGQLIGYLR